MIVLTIYIHQYTPLKLDKLESGIQCSGGQLYEKKNKESAVAGNQILYIFLI